MGTTIHTSAISLMTPPVNPLSPMILAPRSFAKVMARTKFCDHGPASPLPAPPWTETPMRTSSFLSHGLNCSTKILPNPLSLVHALTPPEIERHFGITNGNIHHVDNAVSFADRVPYRIGVDGVYAGAAGCHPAGSVIGCAGHNAARAILSDLGLR